MLIFFIRCGTSFGEALRRESIGGMNIGECPAGRDFTPAAVRWCSVGGMSGEVEPELRSGGELEPERGYIIPAAWRR